MLETAGLNDIEPGAYGREVGISLRTLKRWRRAVLGGGDGQDHRKSSPRDNAHRLSKEEHRQNLLTSHQPAYDSLPPGQIIPALARIRTYSTPPENTSSSAPSPAVTGCCARMVGPIAEPYTTAIGATARCRACERIDPLLCGRETSPVCPPRCGVWLFLYLVIDVWSRWFCTLTTATPCRRLLAKMGGTTTRSSSFHPISGIATRH